MIMWCLCGFSCHDSYFQTIDPVDNCIERHYFTKSFWDSRDCIERHYSTKSFWNSHEIFVSKFQGL